MVTFLITFFLLLGFLIVAVYFRQKPNTNVAPNRLAPPPNPRGLFSLDESSQLTTPTTRSDLEREKAALLERAAHGDKNALRDAHSLNDRHVYDQVLDSLTNSADTDPKLLALVSFLTRTELPVSTTVGRAIIESWQKSPDRSATAKALHIVALANDASLYNDTVLVVMQFWREGLLPDISPIELLSLFGGEFWLLSNKVRSSGCGVCLKTHPYKSSSRIGAAACLHGGHQRRAANHRVLKVRVPLRHVLGRRHQARRARGIKVRCAQPEHRPRARSRRPGPSRPPGSCCGRRCSSCRAA